MWECFVSLRLLVPLPKISSEYACVENKLVDVVHDLLGRVGFGAGVGVCDDTINLTPDNLDGVCGVVFLAEVLVICEPVLIGDDGVGLVELGKHI